MGLSIGVRTSISLPNTFTNMRKSVRKPLAIEAPRAVNADLMSDEKLRSKLLAGLAKIDTDKGFSLNEAVKMILSND